TSSPSSTPSPSVSGFWTENGCSYRKYTQTHMQQMVGCVNHFSDVFSNESKIMVILISRSSEWKYNDSDIDLDDNWTNLTYDDSNWPEGRSPLGFGEDEEPYIRTELRNCAANCSTETITYYFRIKFNISNISEIENLTFTIDYDDSFIAYLNGHEFWKENVNDSNHTTSANSTHNSWLNLNPNAPVWPKYEFNSTELSWLVNESDGENIIAVEIHQNNPTGANLVLNTWLYYFKDNPNASDYDSVSEMCNILANQENQFERHLAAMWFNICSNKVCRQCGTNTALGNNVLISEIIQYCEYIYNHGGTPEEIEYCKNILDNLNNGNGYNNPNYGTQCNYCPPPPEEEEEDEWIPSSCPIRWVCEKVDEECQEDETRRILDCRRVSLCSQEYLDNIADYILYQHKPKEDEFEECIYEPPEEEEIVVEVEAPTVEQQELGGAFVALTLSVWGLLTALFWSLKTV
ncbi:hypothetical protein MBGDC06_00587, partial [Thermoplasmatales archaeon SCGC AB-539-C06]